MEPKYTDDDLEILFQYYQKKEAKRRYVASFLAALVAVMVFVGLSYKNEWWIGPAASLFGVALIWLTDEFALFLERQIKDSQEE
jgi:hypothetical protein